MNVVLMCKEVHDDNNIEASYNKFDKKICTYQFLGLYFIYGIIQ